jgi:hypothetical protein
MKRARTQHVEDRLRSGVPGDVEPPAWIRTRVISRIEDEPQNGSIDLPTRVSRLTAGVLGAASLAVIALGVVLWQTPTVADDSGWESTQAVTLDLSFPTKISTPTLLQDEAKRIQDDFVHLAGVVRVPLSKLNSAVKQY